MPSPLHFLVVDDLPTLRHIIGALLKTLGYTKVSQAAHGEQAIKLIRSTETADAPIDFVLTDWNMPVMDGLALLQAIRTSADLRHLPVLMVTAEEEAASIAAATQAGADGYLVKRSLNAPLLKEALDNVLIKRGFTPHDESSTIVKSKQKIW